MGEILRTHNYLAAVSQATEYVFDGNNGEQYELRALFFPQRLDEGRYAFLSYADLQNGLNERLDSQDERDEKDKNDTSNLHQVLSSYIKQIDADKRTTDYHKRGIDLSAKIKSALKIYKLKKQKNYNSYNEKKDSVKKKDYESEKEKIFGYQDMPSGPIRNISLQRLEEKDSLISEEKDNIGKLVFADSLESRIVVFAGAGYGKSTLIQRIALAYSSVQEISEEDERIDTAFRESIEENPFMEKLIPCILKLRNYNSTWNIEQYIFKSISSMTREMYDNSSIQKWISGNKDRFLLLIDGLDELPIEIAVSFLLELEKYLKINNTHIIMTTRISGIDNENIIMLLRRMKFHGRTIMPLDNREAHMFCEQWISATHDSNNLTRSLERIQSEPHLSYLREFMRKPLELVTLLHYIPKQSFSSFNRWKLFYNILWAEITSHILFDHKQAVYDDECKLLSFIGYKMQMSNKLSISYRELEEMLPELQQLSFYSDLFENVSSGKDLTIDQVWIHLKYLAQNLGIVEIIENVQSITIPIRSYQEYLTAYACCNLCLIEDEAYPNPQKILLLHLNERSWLGVIGFAIAEMEYSASPEFDNFLTLIYRNIESTKSLSTLIETNYDNSRVVTKTLCCSHLGDLSLDEDKIILINKAMTSKSAFSFRWALSSLYKEAFENGKLNFLQGVSYAIFFDCINKKVDPLVTIMTLLQSSTLYERVIGAEMLIILSRVRLDEEPIKKEDFSCKWEASEKIFEVLYFLAIETKVYVFIQALTELYICQIKGYENINKYLDVNLLTLACKCLEDESNKVAQQVISFRSLPADYVHYLRDLINMIGMFPYELGVTSLKNEDMWIEALVSAFYEISRYDITLDQIGTAICSYHLTGSFEELMISWGEDICKGRPSHEVKKDHLTIRENNHFLMVRNDFAYVEDQYFQKIYLYLNTLRSHNDTNPAQLFIVGKDLEALDYSIQLYKEGNEENNNNLAFLIRYLRYDTKQQFGVGRQLLIPDLLEKGVRQHEAYSTMNFVLFLLETNQFQSAQNIIASMTDEAIQKVAEEFWHPVMWVKRKEAEGAFVCLLAHKRALIKLDDYDAMKNCVKEIIPSWLVVL